MCADKRVTASDDLEAEQQNRQTEIRKKIKEIQANTNLTPQEKGKQIQLLMTSQWRSSTSSEQPTSNSKTTLNDAPTYHDKDGKILGCSHYRRNCKLRAACCGQLYTCRRCHDEQVQDHKINRYLTAEMLCMLCKTLQPVGEECSNCKQKMARYYCGQCKFWDDDPKKSIFHCDKCGLCRIGDVTKYYHCDICHLCLSGTKEEHTKHQERAYETACPICNEWLQTSVHSATIPEPCRHPIHTKCQKQYIARGGYSCPICMRTYGNLDMSAHWKWMQQLCTTLKMPEEYQNWKVEILCNDCNIKAVIPFHFIGHECPTCHGYNTRTVHTMRPDGSEVDAEQIPTGGEPAGEQGATDQGSNVEDETMEDDDEYYGNEADGDEDDGDDANDGGDSQPSEDGDGAPVTCNQQ